MALRKDENNPSASSGCAACVPEKQCTRCDAPEDNEAKERRSALLQLGGSAALALAARFVPLPEAVRIVTYLAAYALAGWKVIWTAFQELPHDGVFTEHTLMTIATVGALAIGEYPEAVAVMLFYDIGEILQDLAVSRSRRSIAHLMDIRPEEAHLSTDKGLQTVSPDTVTTGSIIVVEPGERVPLDGIVIGGESTLDTSALTGESLPRPVSREDEVMSGTVNQTGMLTIRVTRPYAQGTVARVLEMVENAGKRKAPTERFIARFSRVYTPAVVGAALLLAVLPPLFGAGSWSMWFQRALIFLVVSCPCALVVSVPLTFFAGIGGASRQGVLVKGGNYLEVLARVRTVVFDKTGTLTRGNFAVASVSPSNGFSRNDVLEIAAMAEIDSHHPIAASIREAYGKPLTNIAVTAFKETPGRGTEAVVKGHTLLAGSAAFLRSENIEIQNVPATGTVTHVARDGMYVGSLIVADELKRDAATAVQGLRNMGVSRIVMLTGDNRAIAQDVGQRTGIDTVVSELLPDQKVAKVEELLRQGPGTLAFVGDGVNDAPVLARADCGVAMGGIGSDAAIEAADVVLMTDEPSKLITGIRIARRTRSIVWQNVIMALSIKLAIMALGAFGLATMWMAVLGDVGVTLLAVLNAMRAMIVPTTTA